MEELKSDKFYRSHGVLQVLLCKYPGIHLHDRFICLFILINRFFINIFKYFCEVIEMIRMNMYSLVYFQNCNIREYEGQMHTFSLCNKGPSAIVWTYIYPSTCISIKISMILFRKNSKNFHLIDNIK